MKVAILGTGQAAQHFVQQHIVEQDEIIAFSTDGTGQFRGQDVTPIRAIATNDYDKVVICSQFVDEIVATLYETQQSLHNLFVYHVKSGRVIAASDMLTHRPGKTLYAYYRLSGMSLAFNFVCFVNAAHVYAKAHGYQNIEFIVASGHFHHVNFGGALAYSSAQHFWRLSNLLPMTAQLSTLYSGFHHFDSEIQADKYLCDINKADCFPDNAVEKGYLSRPVDASYTIGAPMLQRFFEDVQCLHPIDQAADYIERGIIQPAGGKPVVTITLRETTFTGSRNSKLSVWQGFNRYLIEHGFQPVVVRDTAVALSSDSEDLFPGAYTCSAAAFNVHIRAALFDKAHINMGTDCGAIALALFMHNARYCFFFSNVEDTRLMMEGEIAHAAKKGITTQLKVGENYPFLQPYQKVVWSEETLENVIEEFELLQKRIRQTAMCSDVESELAG